MQVRHLMIEISVSQFFFIFKLSFHCSRNFPWAEQSWQGSLRESSLGQRELICQRLNHHRSSNTLSFISRLSRVTKETSKNSLYKIRHTVSSTIMQVVVSIYSFSTVSDNNRLMYFQNSIMHYGKGYFSKTKGKPTMTARMAGVKLGQRKALSVTDCLKVNDLYGCLDGNNPKLMQKYYTLCRVLGF